MEKQSFFQQIKPFLAFFTLELVALTGFNFGNVGTAFGYISLIIAAVIFVSTVKDEKNKKTLFWLALPISLLIFVSAFAGFGNFSKGFTKADNISTFVAIPSFFLLGFCLRKSNQVKSQTVLLVIGIAFAAFSLFAFFSTVIQYGFFYSLIYKVKETPFYYYGGITYDVTKEMSVLSGFKFTETPIEYGSLFAFLSALYLPGLIFVKKEDKTTFRISLTIGTIGILTLLIIPNFSALILAIVVSAFAFIYKYLTKSKKVIKIVGFTFVGIIGLGMLFYVLSIINIYANKPFGFLDELLVNNLFMKSPVELMEYMFHNEAGVNTFSGIIPTQANGEIIRLNVGFFEFQIIKELGVLATFVLLAFILGFGYFLYRYIRYSEDNEFTKVIVAMFLIGFMAFETFYNSFEPEIHDNIYVPFTRNSTFRVVLFVMGFVFLIPSKKEEK